MMLRDSTKWINQRLGNKTAHLAFSLELTSRTICGLPISNSTGSLRLSVFKPESWHEVSSWDHVECVNCNSIYENTNKLENLPPRLQLILLESTEL